MMFPWRDLMRFGLHDLKLPPTEFWRSTLRELSSAAGSIPPPIPTVLRQNLTRMMENYPDATH